MRDTFSVRILRSHLIVQPPNSTETGSITCPVKDALSQVKVFLIISLVWQRLILSSR